MASGPTRQWPAGAGSKSWPFATCGPGLRQQVLPIVCAGNKCHGLWRRARTGGVFPVSDRGARMPRLWASPTWRQEAASEPSAAVGPRPGPCPLGRASCSPTGPLSVPFTVHHRPSSQTETHVCSQYRTARLKSEHCSFRAGVLFSSPGLHVIWRPSSCPAEVVP